jgi:hypothetical protein
MRNGMSGNFAGSTFRGPLSFLASLFFHASGRKQFMHMLMYRRGLFFLLLFEIKATRDSAAS